MRTTVARRRRTRRRSLPRRLLLLVLGTAALLVVASILATLALRWIPPVRSAVMVEQQAWALWRGEKHQTRYRWVPWRRISPYAALAVIAAEDQRFAEHHGFDVKSIEDAIADHERGERLRGASTISQQVAKNVFLWGGRSFVRKGLEAYFTALIELTWPKRRILEVYLNVAELGDGIYGVEAASQRFFRKPAARVTPDEAALLAAVLPNPRRMHPDRPSAYVQERRAWIRAQMDQLGGVTFVKRF